MVRYIVETTKGFRIYFFFLFLMVILSTISGAIFPIITGKIIDQLIYNQKMKNFLLCFLTYMLFYFLNQFFYAILNFIWAFLKVTYVVNIKEQCFIHLLKLKAEVLVRIKSGDVMKRIEEDTESFLDFFHRGLFYVFANFLYLLFSIGYLLSINFYIGIVVIFITPVLVYSIQYFTKILKNVHCEIHKTRSESESWILEMMMGIKEWKILNAGEKVKKDYYSKEKEIIEKEKKSRYINIAADRINQVLILMGQLGIYCIAAIGIRENNITMGEFVVSINYFIAYSTYFSLIGQKLTDIGRNLVQIRRVEEFMSWDEERDESTAEDRSISKGKICFKNVKFGFDNKEILRNINLNIEAGKYVVFVGKSGEGKSTLLQLICRLYDPERGEIYIDDISVKDYTLYSLRKQIAVVNQESCLFHGKLRENIIFTNNKSEDKRIWDVLDGLRLKEVFEEREGLDTIINMKEEGFSGGQIQRIAIARCILKKPKILILDEATSALDEETEKIVNDYLRKELPNTTILSIAHKFSTVLCSDKVVVLENGSVSAIGKHEELIKNNMLYHSLYKEYLEGLEQGRKNDEKYF